MNLTLILKLTIKSILNRRFTSYLTILSICMSVLLLLTVETFRKEVKSSFMQTISGTDLIVGARSGSIQLLLYSVFRIGNATNNISWDSYLDIKAHPSVKWAIPISLGDSHRGFRVMGTTQDYFSHYQYAKKQSLVFSNGRPFEHIYDAVVGFDVAKELGYQLGDKLTLSHGMSSTHFARHDDKPFSLVGILKKTGTPVDKTIHVSLEGIEALHVDWRSGVRSRNGISAEEALTMDLQPKQITAFMLGLTSKLSTFRIQRAINHYQKEPLLAILPGIALSELWRIVGVVEKATLVIALFVIFNSFIGLLTVILTSLNERRRELAILRSLGCRPHQIFLLLASESFLFAAIGCVLGFILFIIGSVVAQPLVNQFGLTIPVFSFGLSQQLLIAGILLFSLVIGCIPGYQAYKSSLIDGMSIKL